MTFSCEYCNTNFTAAPSSKRLFCSRKCYDLSRKYDFKKCIGCNTNFMPKELDQKYCSHSCYLDTSSPWNKGLKGVQSGYWLNKQRSPETKEKLSKAKLGKSYEEMYGDERAKLIKEKQRIAQIHVRNEMEPGWRPNYNKDSIKIIESKAIELGITDLQHAENGGEFHIKELGYWVDGYSKEKNIVFEYDERHHFDIYGKLKEKDQIRQKKIEEYLNCTFIRVKEDGK